ncbi:carbon-nitrogen hydrolase family protein (plasmid) [Streptomyces atratus]|uniref:carbon-nitrogen hydrolase family protein n=1 Tax=Streptomyces atratus TaxID=1893 RepID=UPI001C43405C
MFDARAALARAEELIREAAVRHGAEVIVLPEAFPGGFCEWVGWCQWVGCHRACYALVVR